MNFWIECRQRKIGNCQWRGSAAFPNFRGGTSSSPWAAKCAVPRSKLCFTTGVRTNSRILYFFNTRSVIIYLCFTQKRETKERRLSSVATKEFQKVRRSPKLLARWMKQILFWVCAKSKKKLLALSCQLFGNNPSSPAKSFCYSGRACRRAKIHGRKQNKRD